MLLFCWFPFALLSDGQCHHEAGAAYVGCVKLDVAAYATCQRTGNGQTYARAVVVLIELNKLVEYSFGFSVGDAYACVLY